MATGLEAVGAASGILSFITFASKIVAISYKVYEGTPTDEDELEDYAGRMLDASERVRSRNQQLNQATPAEAKLSEIAEKCVQLASELQKESQSITRRYQKGKFRRAVSMALRANAHKATMKELEQSLERCRKVMETELLFKICDQSTAIEKQQSQAFSQVEHDVQDLIHNIANGQMKIENLVAEEAQKTREVLTTNIATLIKASEAKVITDAQRERLLKSLKPAEIRTRYNDVMSPSDASFERVFASYERVCRKDSDYKDWKKIKRSFLIGMQGGIEDYVDDSDDSHNTDEYDESDERVESDKHDESYEQGEYYESYDSNESDDVDVDNIDCIWECFSTWLQSDDRLFWIQGKPGSGKSTLLKFIIENDNTECLLRSWSPDMRILSYFLWKIGQQSQNSVKGLLCCLLHDLLVDDCDRQNQVLERFSFLKAKDFYQEWSGEEAEEVLSFLLHSASCSACVFIDGLDEISDKDGFDLLIRVLRRIWEIPGVKVCVSSRLETGLITRFEETGAPKLRLHDLTRPEMAVYIQKQLAGFSEGLISASLLKDIISRLLDKAEGVFLWLFLATKSLITGFMNGDDVEILMKRLDELPSELEALYEAMWSRLNANNKVYRETAAMYFHCVIADGWYFEGEDLDRREELPHQVPTLAQLSVVVKVEDDQMSPPRINDKSLHDLKQLCDATERDLGIRCAGMLQVSERSICDTGDSSHDLTTEIHPFTRSVRFIHRTAHDFLVDTKPGQDILSYYSGMKTMIDFRLKMFKSNLYLSTIYRTLGVMANADHVVELCAKLQSQGINDNVMLQLLQVIRNLWNQGVFVKRFSAGPHSFRSLPARLACELTHMEEFFLSWMLQSRSSQDPTVALRDVCLEWNVEEMTGPPTRIIQRLIALGANPHAVGMTSPPMMDCFYQEACFTQETSALELLLRGTLNRFTRGDRDVLPENLEIIDSILPSCPDYWRRKIIVHICQDLDEHAIHYSQLRSWEYLSLFDGWATFEVNMQYLLKRLLAAVATCETPIRDYKAHEIANSTAEPYSRIRNFKKIQPQEQGNPFCYRVIDQEPWKSICDNAFGPIDYMELNVPQLVEGFQDPECDFLVRSYERVSVDDEIDEIASEGLGFYRINSREVNTDW
ncbi:hypothetical protein ACHAPO_010393 [Fusarium lateritium]